MALEEDPMMEQEEELVEAQFQPCLRPRKAEQLGASHLRPELQEQIFQAEQGQAILEHVERVADPEMEQEEGLVEAQLRYSLWDWKSRAKKVHPKNLDRLFLRAD